MGLIIPTLQTWQWNDQASVLKETPLMLVLFLILTLAAQQLKAHRTEAPVWMGQHSSVTETGERGPWTGEDARVRNDGAVYSRG